MNLIPVCAFNPKDASSAARMLNWSADLCGQQPGVCVIAYESGTPADAVQRAASRAFATVEHLPVRSSSDGWPGSANDYFAIVAAEMRTRGPWLWMEPDCVPMTSRWLAALESEFSRLQKLAIGTVIPMFFNRDGRYEEVGKMLAGVAVYHPKIWDRSPLLRSLRQYGTAFAKSGVPPKAFDCYLANDLMKVCGSTPLIQHMGRSREFWREDGKIICTYGPESRWSPVLAPETALVHGVKDSSLIDLLRAEMNLPEREHAAIPVPVIRTIEAKRKAAAPSTWGKSDALPPERPEPAKSPALPPHQNGHRPIKTPVESAPVLPPDARSVETLATARDAIQHWPECMVKSFTLNVSKTERYRVLCQCGAMSAKLPEGVDWTAAWEAQTPVDGPVNEAQDDSALSGASAGLQLDGSSEAEQETHNLQVVGSNPARPTVTMVQVRLAETTIHFSDGSEQRVSMSCVSMPVEERVSDASVIPVKKARGHRAKGHQSKPKKIRTPQEQEKINLRMQKARDGRVKVLAIH